MARGELDHPLITSPAIVHTYAKRLREGRERAGLSQAEAAERAGISQKAISRFETAEAQPDIATFMALAKAYGCRASEIMPREQYPGAPLDPLERRLYFARRNAMIQGNDPEEAVARLLASAPRDAIDKGGRR